MKHIGTVGYIANAPYTTAIGTRSDGAIGHKEKRKFTVEVMFITGTKVICKVLDGRKEKKVKTVSPEEAGLPLVENREENVIDGGKEWEGIPFY